MTIGGDIREQLISKPLLKMLTSHLVVVVTCIFLEQKMRVALGIQPLAQE